MKTDTVSFVLLALFLIALVSPGEIRPNSRKWTSIKGHWLRVRRISQSLSDAEKNASDPIWPLSSDAMTGASFWPETVPSLKSTKRC